MRINPSNLKEVDRHLGNLWQRLKNRKKRHPWSSDKWLRKINGAGVYGIFDKKTHKLVYVGISGDLRSRMNDLKLAIHHSFTKKIGKEYLDKKMPKRGYSIEDSRKLMRYISKNFQVAFQPVILGRKELETWIIDTQDPIYTDKEKRGRFTLLRRKRADQ